MHLPFMFRSFCAGLLLLAISASALAQSKGYDPSRMDKSAQACTDFFQFANGTWLKNTEIPSSESRWGTFNILGDNNNAILREVLEAAAKSKSRSRTAASASPRPI